MLVAAIVTVVVLMAPIAYVAYRKFSVVRQEIEFTAPQDGVAAIHLDIHDDTVAAFASTSPTERAAHSATWMQPDPVGHAPAAAPGWRAGLASPPSLRWAVRASCIMG